MNPTNATIGIASEEAQILTTFENIGIYLGYGSLFLIIISGILGYIYHQMIINSRSKGFDSVRLTAIIKFFHNNILL